MIYLIASQSSPVALLILLHLKVFFPPSKFILAFVLSNSLISCLSFVENIGGAFEKFHGLMATRTYLHVNPSLILNPVVTASDLSGNQPFAFTLGAGLHRSLYENTNFSPLSLSKVKKINPI